MNEPSISRKAVAVKMHTLIMSVWRNRFVVENATLTFRRWLRRYNSAEDRKIIEDYAFGILSDSERRIKQIREAMENDIFRERNGDN